MNSRKSLIDRLQLLSKALGHTPSRMECANSSLTPSSNTYTRRFGSYTKACNAAGLIPNKSGGQRSGIKVNCTSCNTSTYRVPSQKSRTGNYFCSKSCAAIYNNSKFPKRIAKLKLCECGITMKGRGKYCPICLEDRAFVNKTLREALDKSGGHRSTIHSRVRNSARSAGRRCGFKSCLNCNYSKHLEVCHIKAIASYELTAFIYEINNPKNLAPLCRNCHWELDHNLIPVEKIIDLHKLAFPNLWN